MSLSRRDVLVTGATGFIGGALVRRLAHEGARVICPVRPSSPKVGALRALPGVAVVEVPLEDRAALRSALSPFHAEIVMNLASYGVRRQDRDPSAMLSGNAEIVANLLAVAAPWRVQRFIHAGSCSEYGHVGPAPVREDAPLAPTSLYGAAKAAATLYGTALAASLGVPFATLRLFGCFGPGEERNRLVPYLVDRLRREETCLLTPGDQVRDLTYIDDIVDAFLVAADADLGRGGIYHGCSGRGHSVRELGELVADLMGKPRTLLRWGALPHRDDEPRILVGDPGKLMQATGWTPRVNLMEGIRRTIVETRRGPG
jgi:nucleoside-diphosphate-sugar epimerase